MHIIPKEKWKKFDLKTMKCTLLRYSNETRKYKLNNLITKKIILSINIIYDKGKMLLDTMGNWNNMNNDEYWENLE
jgi:hypothetical protein